MPANTTVHNALAGASCAKKTRSFTATSTLSCCMSLSAAARTALRSFTRHNPPCIYRHSLVPAAAAPQQDLQQSPPAAAMSSVPDAKSAINFLTLLQNLKLTKRTGWVRCNVAGPESIADHMYRMAMMAMLCNSSSGSGSSSNGGTTSSSSSSSAPIDSVHCMKMALVHDIAEAIVGDITPHCKVSDEEKFRLEEEAITRIKGMLGEHTAVAGEVEALWREYEAQQTPASHLVKDFDKLEMILQAAEYEGAQGLALQQFFDSTQGKFKTDLGRAWAAEIVKRRPAQQQPQDRRDAA